MKFKLGKKEGKREKKEEEKGGGERKRRRERGGGRAGREEEEGERGKKKGREKIPLDNHFGKPFGPPYLLKLNIKLPTLWASNSSLRSIPKRNRCIFPLKGMYKHVHHRVTQYGP